MTLVDEIRDHVANRIRGQAIDSFPSPHLVVNNFLPEAVFRRVLALNPFQKNQGKEWISTSEMKHRRQDTPYDHRRQIDLVKAEFDADEESRGFWRVLKEAFLEGDWFAQRIYELFPAYFDLRFGEAMRQPHFFSRLRNTMFVQRHDPGYNIGPHTDAPNRVFTCIFSFPDVAGFEQYGTQFHVPRDRDTRCWGDLHHRFEDFEVAKVADYTPNNFVIFFKTRHSFHSVKRIPAGMPNDRYGMQLAYYEPPRGLFKDLSRPDLLEDRTTKPLFKLQAFGRSYQLIRS